MKRTIKACGKTTRIPMSLSNYMAGCTEGYAEAKKEFRNTVNSQPMDPVKICNALNNHKWTTGTFKPYRPIDNGFILITTDFCGNEDLIYITEEA